MNQPGKKKNVLLVDLGVNFGGVEIYLENLVRPLREHVRFVALCAHPEIVKRLRALGVQVVSLPRCGRLSKVFQLISALCLLPFLLVRYGIDTVHINGYAEIMLLPLARILGRTAVATRHLSFDIEADRWYQAPGRFAARFLYRRLAPCASQIICVSQAVGSEVQQLVPPNKVTIIPNWVDSIPPLRLRSLSDNAPVNILFVGRLVEYKGLQVLLDAVQRLGSNKMHCLPRVTIVGDGAYRSELERRAVGINSLFVGFQADVTPYYEAADVFINPSLGPEGSSLVALEAMAQCIPCVLSDLPVHREIAVNGKAAMLFRTGDAEDLARKLEALIASGVARQNYAQSAYRAVQSNHNPEAAVKAYLGVLSI